MPEQVTSKEMIEAAAGILTNVAQILDVVKGEWAQAWSDWDQSQRDSITEWLDAYYERKP